MKKTIKTPVLAVVFLILATLLATFCGIFANSLTANANSSSGAYTFYLEGYDVVYDVSDNMSIAVTEDITVHYTGYSSTGILRDIPVNNGAQVRNVHVMKYEDNNLVAVPYATQIEDSNFLTVDIGDTKNKTGKSEKYHLTYEYRITNSSVNSGKVAVNPIGTGWECEINNATATLILPDGFKSATLYYGKVGSTTTHDFTQTINADGRVQLSTSLPDLQKFSGATFDLTFEEGAISAYFDVTPYYSLIALAVLLVVAIIVKLLVFNGDSLTPIVNFEAPDKLNPLMMGKYIDNIINNGDITSMIFYWASKGYLKINFDDENDPTFIRIVKALPPDTPSYEQHLFYGMFGKNDTVKPSQLKNKFYVTVNAVKSEVNAAAGKLYKSSSLGISILFAVLASFVLGITPMLIAVCGFSYIYIFGFVSLIPSLILYAVAESAVYNRLKHKTKTKLGLYGALLLITAAFAALYCFIIPQQIMSWVVSLLLFVGCSLIVMLATTMVSRTKEYVEKLNMIVGFKNFIQLAEKDKLEAMLEDDPQFYYNILPYAQVLGVSDIWEDKFQEITVQPPEWATSSLAERVLTFHIINSMIKSSMVSATANMVSRPSSSGINGGGFGGGGGGFSGGGFGGGGGRGR